MKDCQYAAVQFKQQRYKDFYQNFVSCNKRKKNNFINFKLFKTMFKSNNSTILYYKFLEAIQIYISGKNFYHICGYYKNENKN